MCGLVCAYSKSIYFGIFGDGVVTPLPRATCDVDRLVRVHGGLLPSQSPELVCLLLHSLRRGLAAATSLGTMLPLAMSGCCCQMRLQTANVGPRPAVQRIASA